MSPSLHLKMKTDPVSETLCFLVIYKFGQWQWAKARNPVILNAFAVKYNE
jgi:hypothetical protein